MRGIGRRQRKANGGEGMERDNERGVWFVDGGEMEAQSKGKVSKEHPCFALCPGTTEGKSRK